MRHTSFELGIILKRISVGYKITQLKTNYIDAIFFLVMLIKFKTRKTRTQEETSIDSYAFPPANNNNKTVKKSFSSVEKKKHLGSDCNSISPQVIFMHLILSFILFLY